MLEEVRDGGGRRGRLSGSGGWELGVNCGDGGRDDGEDGVWARSGQD